MCKKLLVFSLTFCLGLISLQIIRQIQNTSYKNNLPQSDSFKTLQFTSTQTLEENKKGIFRVETDNDIEIKNFYLKFQKAVAENDKKTVASLMEYPLRITFPKDTPEKTYTFIKNQKSLIKIYDKLFDEKLKELIARINVESDKEDIIKKWYGIGLGRGTIWMEIVCGTRNCKDNKRFMKIKLIQANDDWIDVYLNDAN